MLHICIHYKVHDCKCLALSPKHVNLSYHTPASDDKSIQVTLSNMPCSRCRSWDENPSWHRCEDACVNAQGTATLHSGEEIRCSRSWDGTWWFFFCNQCKKVRPHIIGVLRGARIYLCTEHTDYITDSENSSRYCSSEGESCTQEEAEYFFSIHDNTDKQSDP